MRTPSQLNHPLFQGLTRELFDEESKFYQNVELNGFPWDEEGSSFDDLNVSWKNIQSVLDNQFSHSKKGNLEDMKKAIALFLKMLFWSNQKPVVLNQLDEQLDQLEIKPINIKDRIQYVLKRPDSYHAFKQLEELMMEQRKTYASYQIRMRNKQG